MRSAALITKYFFWSNDKIFKNICFIIWINALHHCSNSFKTHSCIDWRLRKRLHISTLVSIELHKDKIPYFNKSISLITIGSWWCSFNMITMIIKNFRARSAWSGVTHWPKIILITKSGNFFRIYANFIFPNFFCFIIVFVNCDP